MTSVFGGPQTVPTSQTTNQSINQASSQQQAAAQASQQQSQILPGPQAQQLGGNILNWSTVVGQPGAVPLQGVAELNQPQLTGITNLINQGTGMQPLIGQGQGYLGQGTGLMGQAGQGITAQDINNFYNPMAGNVTAQLQNIFGQQNLANRLGSVAEAGGIGGDRAAVAAGILANQQTLGAGQIYSQLYQNALQAAQQQKAQQLGAGQALAGTAFPTMQAGFGGLGTALGAAAIPQQQQQQVLNAAYQQAMGQYQDPFLRMQALGAAVGPMNQAFGITQTGQQTGLTGGMQSGQLTGTQLGTGVGTTTYPAPPILPQVAGLGALGLGAMGLFAPSDRRAKTDIQRHGSDPQTGLPLYAYRYKGDPKTYPKVLGPMAQDVAKVYPRAVRQFGNRLAIQHKQGGGAVMPTPALPAPNFPSGADLQARLAPLLTQAQQIIPSLSGRFQTVLGGLSSLAPQAVPATAAAPMGSDGNWLSGHPTERDLQDLGRRLRGDVPGAIVFQSGGSVTAPSAGGVGGYGLKRGGRIQGYQDAGPVVSDTDSDSDSEPDSDTDDSSTTSVTSNLGKYAKGMNILNQYAKRATPQALKATAIQFPSTPWHLGQMQAGGAVDSDDSSGGDGKGKAVQSADSDVAALRFETMANLAQGHEVPPFQKGFAKGGPVKGYADAGEDDGGEDIPMPTPRPTEAPLEESGPRLPPALPRGRMLPGPTGGMGGLGGFAQSPYMALAQAGLGMLAASGQRDARGLPMSPLGAIGAGGMAGMNTLQQQQQFALKQRALDESMALRRAQLGALEEHRRALESVPRITGTDRWGNPVREIYNRATGKYEPVQGGDVAGTPPPVQSPISSTAALTEGVPATATDANKLAEEQGALPANAQLVQHGLFDYSTGSPGDIQKGYDVPNPAPIEGPLGVQSSRQIQQDAANYLEQGNKGLPTVSRGNSPVARQQQTYQNAVKNYANALAQSLDMTPQELAHQWRMNPYAVHWMLGVQGRSATGMGTAMRHLDSLEQAYGALNNGNIQLFNEIKARFGIATGAPEAVALNAMRQIVGTEIIKGLGVAQGGTEVERREAANAYSTRLSPEQFKRTKSEVQNLLAGQLVGRVGEAKNVGVTEEEFERQIGKEQYRQLQQIRQQQGVAPFKEGESVGSHKIGDTKQFMSKSGTPVTGRWDGTKWVPIQ